MFIEQQGGAASVSWCPLVIHPLRTSKASAFLRIIFRWSSQGHLPGSLAKEYVRARPHDTAGGCPLQYRRSADPGRRQIPTGV